MELPCLVFCVRHLLIVYAPFDALVLVQCGRRFLHTSFRLCTRCPTLCLRAVQQRHALA